MKVEYQKKMKCSKYRRYYPLNAVGKMLKSTINIKYKDHKIEPFVYRPKFKISKELGGNTMKKMELNGRRDDKKVLDNKNVGIKDKENRYEGNEPIKEKGKDKQNRDKILSKYKKIEGR